MHTSLQTYINSIILESRQDFIQRKFLLNDKELEKILDLDPTPNKEYLEWLATQLRSNKLNKTKDLSNQLLLFHTLKNTKIMDPSDKQINQFKTPLDLQNVLEKYGLTAFLTEYTKEKWDQYRQIAASVDRKFLQFASDLFFLKNGYLLEDLYKLKEYLSHIENVNELKGIEKIPDLYNYLIKVGKIRSENDFNVEKTLPSIEGQYSKLYEDQRYTVFIPKTFEASCTLGKGTQWCTAASKNDYNYYSKQSDLFIILDKNTGRRTQAHFGSNIQIMDESDKATYLPYALLSLFEPFGAKLRNCIADPLLPVEVLVKLSNDKDLDIRSAVAGNPNTPVEVLEKLSNDKDVYVRQAVARNPNTPVEVLAKLSNDENWYVRSAVAGNSNTPVEVLEKLSNDKDVYIRYTIAKNSNTPVEVLAKLSNDNIWDIRYAVANNPNTPVEVLAKLANDSNEDVRRAVVGNTNYRGVR